MLVVEEVVRWVEDLVWKQEYWLPPGVSWADMDRLAHSERPLPRDLLLVLPLALAFVALRYMFERYAAPPMARCVGVKNRVQVMAAPSPKLEAFYTLRSRQPTPSQIVGLSTQSGKTHRQVQAWFRLRRDQDRPCHTKKFGEAAWRFLFYITAFLAGLACLIDKPWFWDPKECWRHYPLQPMERVHYWYYMLELGFYTSLLLRIYKDIRRKDFKEQVIHHIATIFLLSFSYCANYIRVGTLVMLLHDSSDIVLESAKMFNYGTGWRKTCDNMFVVFTVVFLLTRLVIFPTVIMKTTLISSMEIFQPFTGYYFFNVLLMVLQALHVFWAGLILRMAYKFIFLGKLDKDERSDEESEEEEEEDKDKESDKEKNADYSWERTESLNCKLSMVSSSCVLQNLANHRSSAAHRMRKAQ